MLKLFKCGKCGKEKKHYFASVESVRIIRCVCGSEDYREKLGTFNSRVAYKSQEEIMEHEIDPAIENMQLQMGKELANGDVSMLENLYGEQALKETFAEEDKWLDETDIRNQNL